jgi:hypothetical protein
VKLQANNDVPRRDKLEHNIYKDPSNNSSIYGERGVSLNA